MPEEEEKKVEEAPQEEPKKRIKAVTEEVTSDLPAMKEAEPEHLHEKHHETEPEKTKEQVLEKPAYDNLPVAPDETKSDIKLFILVAVITAIVVAALAGGVYVYITGTRNTNTNPTPTPEVTVPPGSSPEVTPTGSPSANLKLSDYKVQILNGSGKIGEATKAKTLLVKAGFAVGNTGNAATFDFTDTIVQTQASVSADVVSSVKTALSDTYSVKVGTALDSTSDFDIVITVGSK